MVGSKFNFQEDSQKTVRRQLRTKTVQSAARKMGRPRHRPLSDWVRDGALCLADECTPTRMAPVAFCFMVAPVHSSWVLAGALGSVGVGPGFQTPLLYLWPMQIREGLARAAGRTAAFHVGSALAELPPYYVARTLRTQAPGGRLLAFVQRRGALAVFACCCWPNPFVDATGIAAGAAGLEPVEVATGLLAGKLCKGAWQASLVARWGEGAAAAAAGASWWAWWLALALNAITLLLSWHALVVYRRKKIM